MPRELKKFLITLRLGSSTPHFQIRRLRSLQHCQITTACNCLRVEALKHRDFPEKLHFATSNELKDFRHSSPSNYAKLASSMSGSSFRSFVILRAIISVLSRLF